MDKKLLGGVYQYVFSPVQYVKIEYVGLTDQFRH